MGSLSYCAGIVHRHLQQEQAVLPAVHKRPMKFLFRLRPMKFWLMYQ